jgi:hypothetical protein
VDPAPAHRRAQLLLWTEAVAKKSPQTPAHQLVVGRHHARASQNVQLLGRRRHARPLHADSSHHLPSQRFRRVCATASTNRDSAWTPVACPRPRLRIEAEAAAVTRAVTQADPVTEHTTPASGTHAGVFYGSYRALARDEVGASMTWSRELLLRQGDAEAAKRVSRMPSARPEQVSAECRPRHLRLARQALAKGRSRSSMTRTPRSPQCGVSAYTSAERDTMSAACASPKSRSASMSAGSVGARGDAASCALNCSAASGSAPGPSRR